MSDIDFLRDVIKSHDLAIRTTRVNQELMEHLKGSVYYVFNYYEERNLEVPKKDQLIQLLEKANFLIDEITELKAQTSKLTRENYDDSNPNNLPELLVQFW